MEIIDNIFYNFREHPGYIWPLLLSSMAILLFIERIRRKEPSFSGIDKVNRYTIVFMAYATIVSTLGEISIKMNDVSIFQYIKEYAVFVIFFVAYFHHKNILSQNDPNNNI